MKIKEKSDRIPIEKKAHLLTSSSVTKTKDFDEVFVGNIRMSYAQSGHSHMKDYLLFDESVKEVLYPCANAMGCSFNTSLIREVAKAVGEDLRAEDINSAVISGANIKRDPSLNRNAYSYSEDPYHAMKMCEGYAQGIKLRGVEVILDGYGADNSADNRYKNNIIDDRALSELYESGFVSIIRRIKPIGLMAPYAKINGKNFSEDEAMVEDFRKKSGFAGVVFAPYRGGNDVVKNINAGVLPEMGIDDSEVAKKIISSVNSGEIPEEKLSSLFNRTGTVLRKLHANEKIKYMHDSQVNSVLSKVAARECFVLLKNEGNILPLAKNEKIYVIGKNAVSPFMQIKGKYWVNPVNAASFMEVSPKYCVSEYLGDHSSAVLSEEALSDKDIFVVFIGADDTSDQFGKYFRISDEQKKTINTLNSMGKKVIAVITGANCPPIDFADMADAIIYDPLCGEGAYEALCDIIFGVVSPCGKLNQAVAVNYEDYPCAKYTGDDKVSRYMESVLSGYRYFTLGAKKAAFPFGHGLSYSSFEYSSERCSYLKPDGNIDLAFDITNTGDITAKEVVQIYVSDSDKRVFRPGRELKYFEKVSLGPGESTRINVRLNIKDFSYFDTDRGEWYFCSSKYKIEIGSSSEDIRITIPISILSDEIYDEKFSVKEMPSYYPEEGRRLTVANNEYLRICPHGNIPQSTEKSKINEDTPVADLMMLDKQAEKILSVLFEGSIPSDGKKNSEFIPPSDGFASIRKKLTENTSLGDVRKYYRDKLQRPKKPTEISEIILGDK
ncbi:MAG: hypothetical protein E7218_04305 [Anaerofustis stercorihominis]|nr:hypothetical protein [Anaerofustis stercorihominis]